MVNHWVGALAKAVESLPSTKPTVLGAVPWAITLSGFSLPVVKIGTIWSKYLIFLVSIACSVLAGNTFLTEGVHIPGHPRQRHRLAGRHGRRIEARLGHDGRQRLQAYDIDADLHGRAEILDRARHACER